MGSPVGVKVVLLCANTEGVEVVEAVAETAGIATGDQELVGDVQGQGPDLPHHAGSTPGAEAAAGPILHTGDKMCEGTDGDLF